MSTYLFVGFSQRSLFDTLPDILPSLWQEPIVQLGLVDDNDTGSGRLKDDHTSAEHEL